MGAGEGMSRKIKLSDLVPDAHNANRHTERGTYMVNKSLERLGAGRSIVVDKHGKIVAGNLTAEQAADLGIEDVILVETTGRELVAVMRTDMDLDDPQGIARQYAYADNQAAFVSIDFDPMVLAADLAAGVDLGDWFLDFELPSAPPGGNGRGAIPDYDEFNLPLLDGVPDTIWPSDNDYGIPSLVLERQADAFDLPIETWGAKGRGRKVGTYHFYTEDYRFEAIWRRPDQLLQAGCVNVVEPNFSVYDQAPVAVAVWQTYRKRWLARYWQSMGLRVFVDLNVARLHDAINLMGVPRGWRAYATRGYTERLQALDDELAIARKHAGTNDVLFLVYGGGGKVQEWTKANGAVWIVEDMDRAKGKYLEVTHGQR